MTHQEIAVTGVGLITAAGATTEECWDAISNGRSGIRINTLFDTSQLRTEWAGMVEAPLREDLDRCYALAERAIREAFAGADFDPARSDRRVAVVVGSSLGAMPTLEAEHRRFVETSGFDHVAVANSQLHCVADWIAGEFDISGPRIVTSNACAASAVAVGYAAELLWNDEVDVVLCGGVDPLASLSAHGFTCLGALDPQPCSPMAASTGISLGEGAGFMILERTDEARDRGARVIAEVAGYGLTLDGYHQTAPDPTGEGAARSITEALRTAGLHADDIDYVNLHGTGTPTNDVVEPKAIRAVFGKDAPPASTTKSMIGHTLGAAGAVEAVCCILAIATDLQPPTVNTRGLEGATGLDIVPDIGRSAKTDVVLSNSFAFGGNNASLVITRAGQTRDEHIAPRHVRTTAVITGMSAIAGTATSTEETVAAVASGTPLFGVETIEPSEKSMLFGKANIRGLSKGINPAKLRRMDPLSILAAAATNDLLKKFGKLTRAEAEETGVIFATGYGPTTAVSDFHRGIVEHGAAGANALVFPNTVVNAAAGHLAMLNRFRGYTATISTGGTSAIAALHLANRVIERGAAKRILVVIADEFPEMAARTVAGFPGYRGVEEAETGDGMVLSEGCAAFLVESENAATARGVTPVAALEGFGSAGDTDGVGRIDPNGAHWSSAMSTALQQAGIDATDVDAVVPSAVGSDLLSRAEHSAFAATGLADSARHLFKNTTGETFGSSSAIGLVTALSTPEGPSRVLVSAQAYGGSYAALVARRLS
ncbi:3-oxoacyl-ACP synthase [Rhodococcus sp. 06-462-5]|uniref:beta-ketoacyl-[acyl-carrier-protein] synthase family protein n=1 Tax=unclassified Rhodococcus (in: high G+C Gram-positive bacteria) TaxID=192944 RepID=UPI000B9B43F8|nr:MULTISPECIES: beta-ketoacyl-[acyl-carrier-protein] synthase family protein [unclassified Rhodococcus (in: high G+C Gram-positive bacteria)]OZC79379.1 3-oxoacyl-ACP synthase [Rhodococcus sp. 06-462-5]OZE59936.1 3-oxoacyl-ACP synthase [Rhodococcus sp. 02-925g]